MHCLEEILANLLHSRIHNRGTNALDHFRGIFPALFSLNMLSGTEKGRSYSLPELEEMLKAAGAVNLQLLPFQGPTESRILSGVVP